MSIRRYSRRNVFGLDEILNSKIGVDAIRKTLDDALATNNDKTVVSTSVIAELKNSFEQKIQIAKKNAQNLIDDGVVGGTENTWRSEHI